MAQVFFELGFYVFVLLLTCWFTIGLVNTVLPEYHCRVCTVRVYLILFHFGKTPINSFKKNKSSTAMGKVILLNEPNASLCRLVILYVSASVIVRSSTQRWEMAVLWALRLRWRCRSVWTCWRLWVQRLKCAALTLKTLKTDSIWTFTLWSPPASDPLEGGWLCAEQLYLYAE